MKNKNSTHKILSLTENFLLALGELAGELINPFPHRVFREKLLASQMFFNNVKDKNQQAEKLRKEYYSTLRNLEKANYIIVKKGKEGVQVTFSDKGLIKLQRIYWSLKSKELKQKNKGGKICLVVFDIPEEKRRVRDLFRRCLYELGFSRLQKSVFVNDNDVLPELKRVIKNCNLQKLVKIFLAESY